MSPSSNGSLAPSRAAASSACACPARPHAQALRAAAKVSSARLRRVVAERRRSFVRRQCRDVPAASLGPGTGELQGADHLLVGPLCSGGAVPGLPVGIPVSGQRLGEGPMHLPPLRTGRGLVDRRTHQRVPQRERRGAADEEP